MSKLKKILGIVLMLPFSCFIGIVIFMMIFMLCTNIPVAMFIAIICIIILLFLFVYGLGLYQINK